MLFTSISFQIRFSDSCFFSILYQNQSIESAGVAFVKGADERNKFFEKNKQSVMYDEHVHVNKAKD